MSTAKLNIWVTEVGDPCRIDMKHQWYVHVLHCEGDLLNWCDKVYTNLKTKCGHLEIDVPPGCYMVCATWSPAPLGQASPTSLAANFDISSAELKPPEAFAHRLRQRRTRCRSTPSSSPWSSFLRPSADISTMRHRSTKRCGAVRDRAKGASTALCLDVKMIFAAFSPTRSPPAGSRNADPQRTALQVSSEAKLRRSFVGVHVRRRPHPVLRHRRRDRDRQRHSGPSQSPSAVCWAARLQQRLRTSVRVS